MPSASTRRLGRCCLPVLVALLVTASGCALGRRGNAGYVDQAKQMWRRGVAALESGEVGEAESWLRKAAEATPEDAPTQGHLAEALWRSGQHDEALACAEQACRCAPDDYAAATRAGEMRLARGDAQEAAAWGARAIELNTRSPSAWALRGRANERLGATQLALADYQQALRYAPTDPKLLTDVALLHRSRGDHRRALTTMHHLLDAYPPGQEPAGALALAGESYLALDRPRDAAESLQLAADRGPTNAGLLCRLAEARAACGETADAIAGARRALDLDAGHDRSRQLLAKLQATAGTQLR